jgi:phospholipase/lecithinase/hemolysin
MNAWLRSPAVALTILLLPWCAHARLIELSNLFVFGDSLSDGGNSGLRAQEFTGDPSLDFPPPPYAGGRFSNGPAAVEYLWNSFNPGEPFDPSLAGGTNFAIGGATSGVESYLEVNASVPSSLQPAFADHGNAWQLEQFQQYLSTHPAFDPATSLFFVWLFPNDLFYTATTGNLPGTVPGSPGGANLVENGIANILATVQTLASLGAEHILVMNLPNPADTPEFSGTPQAPELDFLTQLFNSALAEQLEQLDLLSAAQIIQFDTDAAFQQVLANPGDFGLTNTSDACVENLENGLCDPATWMFWDGDHPTTRTQEILAELILRQLQVPEPASAALLMLGLLALGIARHGNAR